MTLLSVGVGVVVGVDCRALAEAPGLGAVGDIGAAIVVVDVVVVKANAGA